MSTQETTTPVACPLPWARALRKNMAPPARAERPALEAWLRWHHWLPRGRGAWRDPLDGDEHDLAGATRVQLLREAQRLLQSEGRAWELTGGGACPDTGVWRWVWELRKPGLRGYHTLTQALAREGLLDLPVPAVAPLVRRLRLVAGGRAA